MRKPRRLRKGDLVAVLSPSWGGPALYPATFEAGLHTLEQLGLRVREYPTTRAAAASFAERAADLHAAFADPEIRAIIASIGGDDSILLLPLLDARLIARAPKIVLGYSDTTCLLHFLQAQGCVAFHGPSVMAGLAQAPAYPPAFLDDIHSLLFDAVPRHAYCSFGAYCEGYLPWSDPINAARTLPMLADLGPRCIQGRGIWRGKLWGGCLETLELLKGTPWWPPPAAFDGAVLLIEGSEEVPPPAAYQNLLRSWAAAGNLQRAAALLVGRPRGYDAQRKAELETLLAHTLSVEAKRPDLPVICDCSFGHTDPQWLLPLGCEVEVDAERATITLIEPAVS